MVITVSHLLPGVGITRTPKPPLWFIVIISTQFICLPTLSSTNAPSTKHVEIDLHFVRERVATGAVRVTHVPTSSQYADIFTKGLPSSVFADFRSSLNVQAADVSTTGGVRQIDCLSCVYWARAVSRLGPWAAHPSLLDDREGNLVGSCFYKP